MPRARGLVIPRTLRSGGLLRSIWQLNVHLLRDYGWLRSMRERRAVDKDGQPIPWMTYPAIDFLSQLDLRAKTVFEYGAGASTFYFAARAQRVLSIESDPEWYAELRLRLPENCWIFLSESDPQIYADQIAAHGRLDVIVVDGPGAARPLCCRRALEHLAPGGVVVLDNSDMWPGSAAILRDAGLIQVDLTGFAPLQPHAHTTSVFFDRAYGFRPRGDRQPLKSVAQPSEPWKGF